MENTKMETIIGYRKQIVEIKANLKKADYKVLKFYEGELDEAEFEVVKAERKAWISEINELQAKIKELKASLSN